MFNLDFSWFIFFQYAFRWFMCILAPEFWSRIISPCILHFLCHRTHGVFSLPLILLLIPKACLFFNRVAVEVHKWFDYFIFFLYRLQLQRHIFQSKLVFQSKKVSMTNRLNIKWRFTEKLLSCRCVQTSQCTTCETPHQHYTKLRTKPGTLVPCFISNFYCFYLRTISIVLVFFFLIS